MTNFPSLFVIEPTPLPLHKMVAPLTGSFVSEITDPETAFLFCADNTPGKPISITNRKYTTTKRKPLLLCIYHHLFTRSPNWWWVFVGVFNKVSSRKYQVSSLINQGLA